jgi:hypothetical protein
LLEGRDVTPLKLSVAEQIALAGCFVALLMSGLSFASEPAQLVAPAPFHQLLVEPSVRAAGMGGCSATLLDVPASVLDHPGGAALAHWRTNVSTSYVALVPNADGEFQHRRVSALVRLSDNWSVGGAFVDFPITTLHYSEPEDSSGYDVHHSADVGERLAGFALATRLGDIGLGASATWLSEDLGSDNEHDLVFTGWRWAIGAHYRHALRSRGAVSVAASARNLGPKLESDLDWELEAPAIASIGSSAELQEWIPVPALLAVQYDRWLWPISGRGGCDE